jgi:hypothetical protein
MPAFILRGTVDTVSWVSRLWQLWTASSNYCQIVSVRRKELAWLSCNQRLSCGRQDLGRITLGISKVSYGLYRRMSKALPLGTNFYHSGRERALLECLLLQGPVSISLLAWGSTLYYLRQIEDLTILSYRRICSTSCTLCSSSLQYCSGFGGSGKSISTDEPSAYKSPKYTRASTRWEIALRANQ